jgi:hypothetical protein
LPQKASKKYKQIIALTDLVCNQVELQKEKKIRQRPRTINQQPQFNQPTVPTIKQIKHKSFRASDNKNQSVGACVVGSASLSLSSRRRRLVVVVVAKTETPFLQLQIIKEVVLEKNHSNKHPATQKTYLNSRHQSRRWRRRHCCSHRHRRF